MPDRTPRRFANRHPRLVRHDGDELRNRRVFLRDMVAGIAGGTLASCGRGGASRRPPGDRPNIVVILADDLGIDSLSCYGGETVETPRIDEIAAGGLRFHNCYSTPLCTPSRVELLTGRYPFRTGWTDNIQARLVAKDPAWPPVVDPSERTFATLLKEAGYATAVAGKWQLCLFQEHPDHPHQLGFDEYLLWLWMRQGESDYEVSSRYWMPWLFDHGEIREPVAGTYGPDLFCDYLIDFMRRRRDQPFLVYYPMILPHPPFEMTPRELDPANVTETPLPDPSNYRRMVVYLDEIVGRIYDSIHELGIADNTLILFLSDNGTPESVRVRYRGAVRAGGKGTMSEAGMRVPLIASWQGKLEPGRLRTDLVDLSDFLPTFAELAGIQVPRDREIDGQSFAKVLLGAERGARDWVYAQLRDDWAVRSYRYKLYSDRRLYNVVDDREEEVNLYHEESAVPHRDSLIKVIERLRPS